MGEEQPPIAIPAASDACRIAERVLGGQVIGIHRFPTGSTHYVYDIGFEDGRRCVARLSRPDLRAEAAGAVYWYNCLKPLGVPLPEIYHADPEGLHDGFPVLVMERLRGADLGAVYPSLTIGQKEALARQIADVHRRVSALPSSSGFGYATSYDDPRLRPSWKASLDAELARSRQRLRNAGLFDPTIVEPVQALIDAHAAYFATVEPRPYLDDTTTKNVIVDRGTLSGIVDIDYVAFGDCLMPLALTRASLLTSGYDTAYVEAWTEALEPTAEERAIIPVYTALYFVDFLAEFGHAFNKAAPRPIDHAVVARLQQLLHDTVRSGSG